LADELHAADLAELIDGLPDDSAVQMLEVLPEHHAASALDAIKGSRRADLFQSLPEEARADLLTRMPKAASQDVRELLRYPENTAGGRMTTDFAALRTDLTAERGID